MLDCVVIHSFCIPKRRPPTRKKCNIIEKEEQKRYKKLTLAGGSVTTSRLIKTAHLYAFLQFKPELLRIEPRIHR
jgi:hypothetical protein